jgi:murein L,D-transpeptidase YcbB/YkuD
MPNFIATDSGPRLAAVFLAVFIALGLAAASNAAPSNAAASNAAGASAPLRPAGDAVLALPLAQTEIDTVYRAVDYRLLWQSPGDREALRTAIAALPSHGLDAAAFAPVAALLATTASPTPQDDLALTRAALRYARVLRGQSLRFAALGSDWAIRPPAYDAPHALAQSAAAGDIAGFLAAQPPATPHYRAMQQALARYRAIAADGGWPRVPERPTPQPDAAAAFAALAPDPATASDAQAPAADGATIPPEPPGFPVLEPGLRDSRVPALRARLAVEDQAVIIAADEPELYDPALVAALARFQARHGLLVDGRMGERTLRALNVPAAERAAQIALNLERMRWEPRTAAVREIRVNVPDAHLDLLENGASVLRMRVVVGTRSTRTPALASAIERITVWPRWTIPYSIATKDQLPKLKQNINHLAEQNIVVIGREGDPYGREIDWAAYSTANFPFRLQQRPGPANALGAFRFNFDNRFAVYLHDTPKKKAFTRSLRAASHGCVRLEDAERLAAALLAYDRGSDAAQLAALLAAGRTRELALSTPVPVRLVYFTAFIESDGVVQFRSDLYGRDATLARALGQTRS